jgi:hypothetical protein
MVVMFIALNYLTASFKALPALNAELIVADFD